MRCTQRRRLSCSLGTIGLITLALVLGACSPVQPSATHASPSPSATSTFHTASASPTSSASPAPRALGTVLSAVSCVSASDCWAVGGTGEPSGPTVSPRAIHWDGTTWQARALGLPAGGKSGYLSGVSCAADGCVAVGSYSTGTRVLPLAEYWDGRSWASGIQPTSVRDGYTALSGVYCQTARSCVAVGASYQYQPNGDSTAVGESWDGTTWRAALPPLQAPATRSKLSGVWCYSPGRCTAVGTFTDDQGSQWALSAYWNHGTWTAGNAPYYAAGNAELSSVSCGSPTNCITVGVTYIAADGGSYPTKVTEEWDGHSWRPFSDEPALSSVDKVMLAAVSCWAAYACLVVGGAGRYRTTNDGRPDAWTFTTTGQWGAAPVPAPGGGTGGNFLGVACPAPANCVAVGETGLDRQRAAEHGLIGRWDGTSWRLTTIA